MIKNLPLYFILSFAVIISITAIYISHQTGLMLAYNDATAHLNTARRVIDNLTPGIVQLGSVWLPFLHILQIPFVANDYLWQSGLAGAIVSSLSFILSTFFLYKLILLVTKKVWGAQLGCLLFLTNLNLLYLQTTAMFEPLLIATAMGSIYFLTKWSIKYELHDLIFSAFLLMLATLTRYDGWGLFIASCVLVLIVSLYVKRKSTEGLIIIFVALAGFGIFLWFLYNGLIFGDPLYFQRGEYSAAAQQDAINQRGELSTDKDIILSIITYSLTVLLNVGVVGVAFLILGLIFFLFNNLTRIRYWTPLLLLIPFGFNIVTLYLGQSVIWLPILPPYFDTFFNARYGILMLPAVAFFAGYLASRHWLLQILVGAGIIFQIFLFLVPSFLPILGKEMGLILLKDTVSAVNDQTKSASKFMNQTWDSGLILVSSASADAFIFRSGIPLKNFITEGTGKYWRESLESPDKYATWLVFFQDYSDRVGKVIGQSETVKRDYEMVYKDATYQIWKLNSAKNAAVLGASTNFVKSDETTLWKYQCIDTMKTSRDKAKDWAKDKNLENHIKWEMAAIKDLGANCVAIATPYDPQYRDYLYKWVNGARAENLNVWFRGNFTYWEGWFDEDISADTNKFFTDTQDFILENPTLFKDGDIFTAAPEAENGGPFNQVEVEEYPAYRKFLADEKKISEEAFAQINKNVIVNWASMNGGLARRMLDEPTIQNLGGIVTLDHYVRDAAQMDEYINYFKNHSKAKTVIGEFGAPIEDITGNMTEDQQAEFVGSLMDSLYRNKDQVEAINYWVLYDSSTAIFETDRKERKVAEVLRGYFQPMIVRGNVKNRLGDSLENVTVETSDGVNQVKTDFQGNYRILLPQRIDKKVKLLYEASGYQGVEVEFEVEKGIVADKNVIMNTLNEDFMYKLKYYLRVGK